ncbi:MAG: hypothetical protein PHE55_00540 [Methylococcaceae bacterium]|nr:hypothetical protein [Methylococcaceae bacterium]
MLQAQPEWKPEVAMPKNPRWFSPPLYGLKTYGDLFTPRQLVALTTFSDLVQEALERCRQNAEFGTINAGSQRVGAHSETVEITFLRISIESVTNRGDLPCIGKDDASHSFTEDAEHIIYSFSQLKL